MLLNGKTSYRANNNGGGGNDTYRTPVELDLGLITITGDYPTDQELADALNNYPTPIDITSNELYVFKVSYQKQQES